MAGTRGGILALVAVAFFTFSLLPRDAGAEKVAALTPAQIKKDNWGKDVLKIDVRPGGGAVKNSEGLIYWEQTIEIYYKTEWKGVTYILRGDVEYHWGGNKWVFVRFRKNDSWYTGVDPPSQADIEKALAASNAGDLFDTYLQKQTSQVFSVKLDKDPKFSFSSPNEVSFNLVVEYEVISSDELRRVKQTGSVGLKRGSPKEKWSASCRPDNPCLLGGIGSGGQRFDVSSRKMTAEQLKKIPTLFQIGLDKWVTPKYAALGAPEKFKNETEFARYAYKALRTGDLKTWDAFLIRNHGEFAPEAYDKGRDWFIKPFEQWKRQYCPELVLQERPGKRTANGVSVYFLDKAKGNKGYIRVDTRGDGFWVNDLALELADGAKADEVAAVPEATACVETLPPEVDPNPLGLKVDDQVVGKLPKWKVEHLGTIAQMKRNDPGIGLVYLDNGSYEDMPLNQLRRATPEDVAAFKAAKGKGLPPGGQPAAPTDPGTAKGADKPAADKPAAVEKPKPEMPAGLAVGDRVMSKWQGNGKELPGVVKTLKPGKVMVWYDDGSKEWVPAEAVRKVE